MTVGQWLPWDFVKKVSLYISEYKKCVMVIYLWSESLIIMFDLPGNITIASVGKHYHNWI